MINSGQPAASVETHEFTVKARNLEGLCRLCGQPRSAAVHQTHDRVEQCAHVCPVEWGHNKAHWCQLLPGHKEPHRHLCDRVESEPELEPCAHCGGLAVLTNRSGDEWVVECENRFNRDLEAMCPVNSRTRSGLQRWQAVATWNTRAGSPPPDEIRRQAFEEAAQLTEQGVEYSDSDGMRDLDSRGLKVLASEIRALASSAPAQPKEQGKCVNHCGHDPMVTLNGACVRNIYETTETLLSVRQCGHVCEFAPQADSAAMREIYECNLLCDIHCPKETQITTLTESVVKAQSIAIQRGNDLIELRAEIATLKAENEKLKAVLGTAPGS